MFDVTNPIAFHIHGGGHGGIASAVGDLLAFIESLTAMQAPEIYAALLPGVAVMGNIHPIFVHFPIAFLLAFFILDVVASIAKREDWRSVAGWLLYMGAASTIAAVATGLYAAETVLHGENVHAIMDRHQNFGFAVLALALLLSLWRWLGRDLLKRAGNIFYLGVAALMIVCMILGTDLGGLMVYHYGVNVSIEPPLENAVLPRHDHQHQNEAVDMDIDVEEHEHGHEDGHNHTHTHSHSD